MHVQAAANMAAISSMFPCFSARRLLARHRWGRTGNPWQLMQRLNYLSFFRFSFFCLRRGAAGGCFSSTCDAGASSGLFSFVSAEPVGGGLSPQPGSDVLQEVLQIVCWSHTSAVSAYSWRRRFCGWGCLRGCGPACFEKDEAKGRREKRAAWPEAQVQGRPG